jgi:hypothetical protein
MMKHVQILSLMLLVISIANTGCDKPAAKPTTQTPPAENVTRHSAGHVHGAGPNGGAVFDLGKYHAEFTVDHAKSECTVLIVTGDKPDAKSVPVSATELTLTTLETKTADGTVVAPMTIKLLPVDASDGKAAKFVGTDPGIANVADFAGSVVGEIDGKPSQGEFKE